ncbi:MAG: DUF6527 family protein [Balneola sp.]
MSKKTRLLKRFLYWFEGRFGEHRKPYKLEIVDAVPEKLKNRTIYIERLNGKDYELDFACPFKCGEVIQLNMDKTYHPFWKVYPKNKITITPSIDVQDVCRCHYFIQNGKIKIAQ